MPIVAPYSRYLQLNGRHDRVAFQISVALPPAAVIFSLADALNACADTWSRTPPSSPVPSTFTGWFLRTAPASASSSGPIAPPSGNSSASRSRLTTWYVTLNRFLKPLSFGSRMWMGICPPSNEAGMFLRAFDPLVPRPAVLPFEPPPRPTRVLAVLAPGAGRRWWTLIVIYSTSSTFTRWFTVKIMPRISGRSSFTTTSLIRLSPSVRSVSRWLRLDPIPDRTWVTFNRAMPFTPPHPRARPAWRRARRPRPGGRGGRRPPPGTPASSARPPRRARC